MKIPRLTLDKAFYLSLVVKAVVGVFELGGGILLLFVRKSQLNHFGHALLAHRIDHDRDDIVYRYMSHFVTHISGGTIRFAAVYLIADAVLKLCLIYQVFHKRYWAYIALIVVLSVLAVYQTYRITLTHSALLSLLTLFDVLIIYLSAKEYLRHRNTAGNNESKLA
ncbi:MAG TPA: DUF2127 domain-containing protein [Candidatus Saccharimonadia bacterium]|nr:DUF2127 domain-containing protein [Candidatus Saccharimonadia bacterium]